eukprot:gene41239-54638_t
MELQSRYYTAPIWHHPRCVETDVILAQLFGFPFSAVQNLGGFSAFALVYFTSQVYSRYQQMYNVAKEITGKILSTTFLAKASLPLASAKRINRYMNTAHILGYIGCSDAYDKSNLLIPLNDKYELLTELEYARIEQIGYNGTLAAREIISWTLEEVVYQYKAK